MTQDSLTQELLTFVKINRDASTHCPSNKKVDARVEVFFK